LLSGGDPPAFQGVTNIAPPAAISAG